VIDALTTARERVDRASDESERQRALIDLASALYEHDAADAIRVAEEAMELAARRGDDLAHAWARHHHAWGLSALGRLDEALAAQLDVFDEFERLGEGTGAAHALMAIGDIYGDAGDTATSLEYLERARQRMEGAQDRTGRGVVLNLTGIVLSHEGRHREAAAHFEEAESIFVGIDDAVRVAMVQINRGFELLSLAADESGPHDLAAEAMRLADQVIEAGVALGARGRNTLAYGRSLLATGYAAAGRLDDALGEAAAAELVALEGGFEALAVEIRHDRVAWLTRDGRLCDAKALLDQTGASDLAARSRRIAARTEELRADILEAMGDHQGALTALREFHRLDREVHGEAAERRSRLTAERFQIEQAHREAALAQVRVDELEALDRDKRDFLASVSHELRTPLAAVLGFATELADSWDGFDTKEAHTLVSLIASQAEDIASIVEDLLTLTRLEAGTMSVHPVAVNLQEHVAGLVATLARSTGREVTWAGNATVIADPTRLRQVLRNLVTNAFRYGGEIVRVHVRDEGSSAVVDVRDTGGPIPASRVRTMFEPFDHGDHAMTMPHSVGMGLAVARSLAVLMGGSLDYMHDGIESIFRLTLPARPYDR
jgi:signal transduction histidine kinase